MAELTDPAANPALALLLDRRSHHRLVDPGPSGVELDLILRAALRVPDFGRLRPFRFLVARGEGRERLGLALQRAAAAGGRPTHVVERAPRMPLRAPLVIVAVSCPKPSETVPLLDQQLCAGSTVLTMQLAARTLGFSGIWRSGWPMYDRRVQRELGLSEAEGIVGFLYLGTPVESEEPASTPADPRDFLSWL